MASSARYRRLGLGVPLGLTAVATASAWIGARRLVAPRPTIERYITPWELGIPFERVELRTPDGVTLRGWWLPSLGAEHSVVALPGHRSGKADLIGISGALWRVGMNVLMFDFRGRGESEYSINTLGYLETVDALAAVEWVASRTPGGIALVGYSMGASVAILAAARDERIRVVVADSPFATQREVVRRYFHARSRLPAFPLVHLMERFLPYDQAQVEPIRVIRQISPRAVLLIHGEADGLIEVGDSQRLYEAAGDPKELWTVPGVGHCGGYFLDRDAYARKVAGFLRAHL